MLLLKLIFVVTQSSAPRLPARIKRSRSGSYRESIASRNNNDALLNGEDNIIRTPSLARSLSLSLSLSERSPSAPSFQLLPLFIPRALTRVTVNCFEQAAVENGKRNGERGVGRIARSPREMKRESFPDSSWPAERTTRLRSHSISLSRHSVMIHAAAYEIHTLCPINP